MKLQVQRFKVLDDRKCPSSQVGQNDVIVLGPGLFGYRSSDAVSLAF